MKRLIAVAASTVVLTSGLAATGTAAVAAPTSKWKAPLVAVDVAEDATGAVQIVQTRSRKAPTYSFSLKVTALDAAACYEVATSSDGVTRTVLGTATSSDAGALDVSRRVASEAVGTVTVALCGQADVLASGAFVAR